MQPKLADPAVSVVIPTFNRVSLLPRALDSVLTHQTCRPQEVIVVDDGSTDDTASFLQNHYPDVLYLYQPNHGVSAARNRGIEASTSPWIAFLDSDDAWLPHKLSRQLEAVRGNPEMRICHTDELWIRNDVRINPKKKHRKSGGWIFSKCLSLCCMSPSSVMLHRSVFDTVGFFDESLPVCEDYDLWLRVTARFPVLYVDHPLVIKYGGHHDQLSGQQWGMDRFRIRALEKILSSGILSPGNSRATLEILEEKLNIFIHGARKRQKWGDVEIYEQKRQQALRSSRATLPWATQRKS
ncbi:MAG: glycosyltransferase family 2 protein [Fidelibacterota bacterium]